MTQKIVSGMELALEASGGSIVNGAFGQANDNNVLATNDPGFPFIRFRLEAGNASAALTAGPNIVLCRQALNQEGNASSDAPVPDSTYPHDRVGAFKVDAVTGVQYLYLDKDIRRLTGADESYYLQNASGQTLDAGWKLYATPFSWQDV